MRDAGDQRERELAEREQALSDARAALRAEMESAGADRAEAARLIAEARVERGRARKLAMRFARRLKRRLVAEQRACAADRAHLAKQTAQLNAIRAEFHAAAAAARDRLRDAWAAVETQQQRAGTEWAEANRYFAEQVAALDARVAELDSRESTAAKRLAQTEAEVAGLREEATALEQRATHARAALAELEVRRDRARAELLRTDLPIEVVPARDADDLAHRELLLEREKCAVAALRSSLELESADLDDRRRLAAEQLAELAEARALGAARAADRRRDGGTRPLAHREQRSTPANRGSSGPTSLTRGRA